MLKWFFNLFRKKEKIVPIVPLTDINFERDFKFLMFLLDSEINNIYTNMEQLFLKDRNRRSPIKQKDVEELVKTASVNVIENLNDRYKQVLLGYTTDTGLVKIITDIVFRKVFTKALDNNINIINGEVQSTDITDKTE